MFSGLALTAVLALGAGADCTPAAPTALAELERAAAAAERKADQAESESVRSGNPGAARRAELARQEAVDTRRRAAAAACQPLPPEPARKPAKGY